MRITKGHSTESNGHHTFKQRADYLNRLRVNSQTLISTLTPRKNGTHKTLEHNIIPTLGFLRRNVRGPGATIRETSLCPSICITTMTPHLRAGRTSFNSCSVDRFIRGHTRTRDTVKKRWIHEPATIKIFLFSIILYPLSTFAQTQIASMWQFTAMKYTTYQWTQHEPQNEPIANITWPETTSSPLICVTPNE